MEESRALALNLSCAEIDAVASGVFKKLQQNAVFGLRGERGDGGKKAFTSISAGLPFASLARPDGGTGRRAGLKIPFPQKECRFDPDSGHFSEAVARC